MAVTKAVESHKRSTETLSSKFQLLVLLLLNDLNGLSDDAMYSLGGVLLISRVVHYLMITTKAYP